MTDSLLPLRSWYGIGHEWEYLYPAGFERCRLCSELMLGQPRPCLTPEAAAAFRGARASGEGGLGMPAGEAFDADHVVAADRLGDGAKDAHVR